jgi:WD40 repeat protein
VRSVAYSPDGKWIASGRSWDKAVQIWDAATGAPVGSPLTVDAGNRGVLSVSFSPKDNVIAAGCSNGKIHLVDAVAGEVKSSLTGHRYVPFPCIECFLSYFGTDLVF